MAGSFLSWRLLFLLFSLDRQCARAENLDAANARESIVLAPGEKIECTIVDTDDTGGSAQIDGLHCNGVHFVSRHYLRRDESMCSEASDILAPLTPQWWKYLACAVACIMCAAMAAGLTLGLLSLDPWQLKILRNTNADDLEPSEQSLLEENKGHAKAVLPLISGRFFKGSKRASAMIPGCLNPSSNHYLLVTLLLWNSAANEALPIFFDHLLPASIAILVSVTVVLIFGEIVPSAIFTGDNKLKIAARLSYLVRILEFSVLPIAWPLSLALDKLLGHQQDQHRRAELRAFITSMTEESTELPKVESEIMHSVLELSRRFAKDIAKPLKDAKMMSSDTIIDGDCIRDLLAWRHSRIIVYRRDVQSGHDAFDILGVLPVKRLLGSNIMGHSLGDLRDAFQVPVTLHPDDDLLTVLNKFKKGSCHIALVGSGPEVLAESIVKGTSLPPALKPTMFCSLEDVVLALIERGTECALSLPARFASNPSIVTTARWNKSTVMLESDSEEEDKEVSSSDSSA
eukprot:TRINITY_DN19279_c0_g1_i1.p1 TRINITY_DN19279_c0_g1~~TRINITY_DN19279_c0_g1_i1.p1  ORF type:complete len:515 (+),score=69.34 TRINITY_DN19279_c0_g1_i1:89-1633(+)